MFTKSNLLGTLAGLVLIFLIGFVFFGPLLESFWSVHSNAPEGMYREQPDWFFLILGILFEGFFISTIYGQLNKKPHSFLTGMIIGLLVAGYYWGTCIYDYSTKDVIDITALIATGLFSFIQYGVTGGVIALVYKATDKS